MSEIDQQFIEFVVKSLVGKPDAVEIKRTIDEKGVLLELTVDPEDLGRVIGKRGATAQSLRTLLRALGTKNDARYNLKIVDNGVDRPVPSSNDSRDNTKSGATAKDTGIPAQDDALVVQSPADDTASDSAETEATEAEATSQEPSETTAAAEPTEQSDDDEASERLRKTREELADLDDLDV